MPIIQNFLAPFDEVLMDFMFVSILVLICLLSLAAGIEGFIRILGG